MAGMKMNKCQDKLIELLPESIKHDSSINNIVTAIQPQIDDVCKNTSLVELYSRIDELPESILMILAWENSLIGPEWILARTIEHKRALVKDSFILNKRRGTLWAVKRIFDLVGYRAEIVEWFDDGKNPFTFKITMLDIGNTGISSETLITILDMINIYKPLTRHNDGINVTPSALQATAKVGMMINTKVKLTVSHVFQLIPETVTADISISVTANKKIII